MLITKTLYAIRKLSIYNYNTRYKDHYNQEIPGYVLCKIYFHLCNGIKYDDWSK